MEYQFIKFEAANGIGVLRFDRPEVYNALCEEMSLEIADLLGKVAKDESVRVLILTGGDKVFVAGADVKRMANATVMEAVAKSARSHRNNDALEELPIPTIAAVCGPAFGGGCELALCCDFRIAGEHASFACPEVGLGIFPSAGATHRLASLIGETRAREMILLGERIKGPRAAEIGLVNKTVADDKVLEEAMAMAEKLMEKPAYALAQAKRVMLLDRRFGEAAGKEFEDQLFGMCFANPDQQEGMAAFIEKRKPVFRNIR